MRPKGKGFKYKTPTYEDLPGFETLTLEQLGFLEDILAPEDDDVAIDWQYDKIVDTINDKMGEDTADEEYAMVDGEEPPEVPTKEPPLSEDSSEE